jgi:hypothetical protein
MAVTLNFFRGRISLEKTLNEKVQVLVGESVTGIFVVVLFVVVLLGEEQRVQRQTSLVVKDMCCRRV